MNITGINEGHTPSQNEDVYPTFNPERVWDYNNTWTPSPYTASLAPQTNTNWTEAGKGIIQAVSAFTFAGMATTATAATTTTWGAQAGATLGTFVGGPVGTIIGGTIGGLLGLGISFAVGTAAATTTGEIYDALTGNESIFTGGGLEALEKRNKPFLDLRPGSRWSSNHRRKSLTIWQSRFKCRRSLYKFSNP